MVNATEIRGIAKSTIAGLCLDKGQVRLSVRLQPGLVSDQGEAMSDI